MHKLIASTGLAVVLAAVATTTAFGADMAVRADQVRAEKLIGASVYDRQNQDVASVKDLVLDKDGKVANVVLSYGATAGLGGKYIAVNFTSLKMANNRVTLDTTKAQLAAMPEYKLDDAATTSTAPVAPPVANPTGGNQR